MIHAADVPIAPDDAGCHAPLSRGQLEPRADLTIEHMRVRRTSYDTSGPSAQAATGPRLSALSGHTDVVPAAAREEVVADPFEPVCCGAACCSARGAADMKSGVAAMDDNRGQSRCRASRLSGAIGFVITSDEEGPSVRHAARRRSAAANAGARYFCIVSEPSSCRHFGDLCASRQPPRLAVRPP